MLSREDWTGLGVSSRAIARWFMLNNFLGDSEMLGKMTKDLLVKVLAKVEKEEIELEVAKLEVVRSESEELVELLKEELVKRAV
jgi:hypothetical protein